MKIVQQRNAALVDLTKNYIPCLFTLCFQRKLSIGITQPRVCGKNKNVNKTRQNSPFFEEIRIEGNSIKQCGFRLELKYLHFQVAVDVLDASFETKSRGNGVEKNRPKIGVFRSEISSRFLGQCRTFDRTIGTQDRSQNDVD